MRSGATLTHGRSRGNGGAAIVSTGARIARRRYQRATATPPSAAAPGCRHPAVTCRTQPRRARGRGRTLSGHMTTPENPPPGGDETGRGLSGVQRAGIVLGGLAVLLIVFVVLQSGGSDNGGSSSSSSSAAQTTSTQSTSTAQT